MIPQPGADSLRLFDLPEAGSGGCPDFVLETDLARRGRRAIAGIDEAGRGPLAGPVVAAAVILDPLRIPAGLDDSKALKRERREALFAELAANARIGWCAVAAPRIDAINILQATLEAMCGAAAALGEAADSCLIDGRDVPGPLRGKGRAIVGGDAKCLSIAAASIVAKVVRDRMMERSGLRFPGYGLERHMGYSTPEHMEALRRLGPCVLHRRSFAPVREALPGAA